MKSRQSKIVLAAVLMAALNTSGCQMLSGLLGGGGGGGLMSMLGPLLGGGGAGLTELAQNDLFLTSNDMATANLQWSVTPSKKEQRKDAALLYGSFGSR